MGGMLMTVRAHDARSALYRMIRPAPDGRRRARILARRRAMRNNGVSEAADASVTRAQQPARRDVHPELKTQPRDAVPDRRDRDVRPVRASSA
jgi:hypothetical protein